MKKILIVDDEKNIRTTMKMALDKQGYQVETAINGEEALRIFKDERHDVILLDLKLPGMSGIETLKEIMKINGQGPKPQVIIITAHGSIETAVEAMKAGAIDFIQKPFTPKEISNIVEGNINIQSGNFIEKDTTYDGLLIQIIEQIRQKKTRGTFPQIKQAISLAPQRPEGYNLLGVYYEKIGDRNAALKYYRASNAIDPTYKPAIENIDRAASMHPDKSVSLGEIHDETN
jgi:DNA-binding NtrC family response regulator